jgi:hypothetical protein
MVDHLLRRIEPRQRLYGIVFAALRQVPAPRVVHGAYPNEETHMKLTKQGTSARAAAVALAGLLSAGALGAGFDTPVTAQHLQTGSQKAQRASRLAQLQQVLAGENQAIDILRYNEPAGVKGHEPPALAALTRSRDATQRLINDVQDNSGDAGIQKNHDRDRAAARGAVASGDAGAALNQAQGILQNQYNRLLKDPGVKNEHHKNAVKFLQEARGSLQSEIDAYARAHPAAQPAAAPMPATATPQIAATSAQQVKDLQAIISHEDHAIDIINFQPADQGDLRLKTLSAIIAARDAVRQLSGASQNRSAADLAKDTQADHARDAAGRVDTTLTGYQGMVRVQEYLNNDHATLARQPDDAGHLRAAA